MIQTKHWKAGEIPQKSGKCGSQAGTSVIPKKEWPMRSRDSASNSVVIPQGKKRGRPPLKRSVNLDHLKKEPSTNEDPHTSSKTLKTEATMIPINNMAENAAVPEKKKRGRPPVIRPLSITPKIEDSGRAISVTAGDKTFGGKKGRGRPIGSLSKKVHNKPSTSFQSLLGLKRGRGRPKKTEMLLLKKTLNGPNITALTKQITVRLTKMNEDIITMAGRKTPLKVEDNKIVAEKKKIPYSAIRETKKLARGNKNSLEKGKINTKNAVVELTDIMKGKKAAIRKKAAKVASVTVVLEKQRGRPKKQPPSKGKSKQVSHRNTLSGKFKTEPCQVFNQLPGDFNSQRVEMPTVSTGVQQIPQETISPVLVQQGSWEAEEAAHEGVQMQQYPGWHARPSHTAWTLDDGAESLDSSSVTQFVVGEPMAPQTSQSQCCKEPEHFNFQEDLLQGLSDFRCRMTRELAATRREVREGAEVVRSAIAGVSTEIHRLGIILQPLVNVIATGNLFCRSSNYAAMASMFPPQQETPPEDTIDVPQSSAAQKNSFTIRHEVTSLDHVACRDTPTECSTESLPEIISSVKIEDLTGPQPCTYQTQSTLFMEAEKPSTQSLLLSQHDLSQACPMRPPHKVTTSATSSDFCADVPPSITHHVNSHDCQLEDSGTTHCTSLSEENAPTEDSLRLLPNITSSANHDNLTDNSSQRDSPPINSGDHYTDNESIVCSVDSLHKDSSPAMSTDHQTQDLIPNNFEEHPEKDTNPDLHQYMSPTPSAGNLQEDMDQVMDLPSLESNTFLCQAQKSSLINLQTPPVTVPDSSIGSSAETLHGEAGNLEGVFFEETLSKSSQNFSATFLNSVVPSQTPPTSPRAHTPLL